MQIIERSQTFDSPLAMERNDLEEVKETFEDDVVGEDDDLANYDPQVTTKNISRTQNEFN